MKKEPDQLTKSRFGVSARNLGVRFARLRRSATRTKSKNFCVKNGGLIKYHYQPRKSPLKCLQDLSPARGNID